MRRELLQSVNAPSLSYGPFSDRVPGARLIWYSLSRLGQVTPTAHRLKQHGVDAMMCIAVKASRVTMHGVVRGEPDNLLVG